MLSVSPTAVSSKISNESHRHLRTKPGCIFLHFVQHENIFLNQIYKYSI